jgi:hypothetical protein
MAEWGSPVERETRLRIQVAMWAYAYEVLNESLVDDHKFDQACCQVNLDQPTNRPDLDQWFKTCFHPHTGQWIHKHPELGRIAELTKATLQARGIDMSDIIDGTCTEITEPEHSGKGGSGAERWMNCPGSSVLLNKLKLPQSDEPDYRRDGVAAHEAGYHCLSTGCDTWEIVGQKFHDVETDQEIADAVQIYLNDVRQFMVPGATIYLEERIGDDPATRPHPDFYGRLDFGAVLPDALIVEDYKHGEGIIVEPDENPQMLYYAYGIILKLKARGIQFRSDMLARLRICQPRAHHDEGSIREWETTVGEIVHWGETVLIPAMHRADIDNTLDVGKHCRFCPAKLFCPLLDGLYGAACRADPTLVPNFGQQRMALEYAQLEAVGFYIKALKDEVYRRNMLGNTVPGTKLVLKKANRVNKEGAEEAYKAVLGDEIYTKPELKTPAEIEKIGPKAKALVSEWAYTPQTGLTVAPESDRKAAVKVEKAVDIFAHLIEAGDAEVQVTTATGDTNG